MICQQCQPLIRMPLEQYRSLRNRCKALPPCLCSLSDWIDYSFLAVQLVQYFLKEKAGIHSRNNSHMNWTSCVKKRKGSHSRNYNMIWASCVRRRKGSQSLVYWTKFLEKIGEHGKSRRIWAGHTGVRTQATCLEGKDAIHYIIRPHTNPLLSSYIATSYRSAKHRHKGPCQLWYP